MIEPSQMHIYILDGKAVTKLDDQYALYLPDEDELVITSPMGIVHFVEGMYMEETPEGFEGEVEVNAYVYPLRGDVVDYSQDIWNTVIDTVEELRDMFLGEFVNDASSAEAGNMYMDTKTQTMNVRIDGQWIPIQQDQ